MQRSERVLWRLARPSSGAAAVLLHTNTLTLPVPLYGVMARAPARAKPARTVRVGGRAEGAVRPCSRQGTRYDRGTYYGRVSDEGGDLWGGRGGGGGNPGLVWLKCESRPPKQCGVSPSAELSSSARPAMVYILQEMVSPAPVRWAVSFIISPLYGRYFVPRKPRRGSWL